MSAISRRALSVLLVLGLAGPFAAPAAAAGGGNRWRQPAEFEPQLGTMIDYRLFVPVQLVVELAEEDLLVTIVNDAVEERAARRLYAASGVDLANCTFLRAPNESHWTRDYGPWFAFDRKGRAEVVDFVYEWPNAPGDDGIPGVYAQDQGLGSQFLDLVTAGGNYMTDGQGTAMGTGEWLLFNNPGKTPAQIDALLEQALGIERHHYLSDPDMYWFHIDCFAKYLDPDTILVAEVAPDHSKYHQLEWTVDYLERQISCWGTPYEVVRVFLPPGKYYTNSLVLNGKVLVPIEGGLPADAAALDAYRSAMPGYEVIGIPSLTDPWPNQWVSHDALHCRTKELVDPEMLYVGHRPLLDRPATAGGFRVEAEVIAHSGASLLAGQPQLRWRTSGAWNAVAMTHLPGDRYEGWIPAQPAGTRIQYFVHAEDASGRSESHPYVGAPGAHSFVVNTLGTDVRAVSTRDVGPVEFLLDAGPANAGRPYLLLGTTSGTKPGLQLPGGLTLTLNRDAFMGHVRENANTPSFRGFAGTLDVNGRAIARMDLSGAALPAQPGESMHFAFLTAAPFGFVSNAIEVRILD
jgi:agmatine/peptidylarginine deiminase